MSEMLSKMYKVMFKITDTLSNYLKKFLDNGQLSCVYSILHITCLNASHPYLALGTEKYPLNPRNSPVTFLVLFHYKIIVLYIKLFFLVFIMIINL